MGMDRGSRVGGSGQNGYRRDYGPRNGYGRDSDTPHYTDHGAGGYDHGGKYEQERAVNGGRRGGDDHVPASGGGRNAERAQNGHSNNGHSNNGHSNGGEMLPQALIESLEKKIAAAHSDMSQALNDITGKENEKFDLIFGILIELQKRQASLEDSVRLLKTQLPPAPAGMGQQALPPQAQSQAAPGQAQSQSSGLNGSLGPNGSAQNFMPQGNQQMGGQMGNQQMFMSNQQMNMGQQYVNPDGSVVFLVPAPQGMAANGMQQGMQQMGQMSYAMPQMMSGPMQPQMAMQFVSQEQSGMPVQWQAADQSSQSSEAARANGAQAPQNAGDKSSMGQASTTTGVDTPDGNEADFERGSRSE